MWNVSGIAQRAPQFVDSQIDGVVEIPKAFLRPDQLPQFLSGHHLPGTLQQSGKNLEWLVLYLQPDTRFPQFAGL
jgi:hypothetical protein